MIQRIEVDICPKLGSLVADGQTAWPCDRKEIITWKVTLPILVCQDAIAADNDLVDEPAAVWAEDVAE